MCIERRAPRKEHNHHSKDSCILAYPQAYHQHWNKKLYLFQFALIMNLLILISALTLNSTASTASLSRRVLTFSWHSGTSGKTARSSSFLTPPFLNWCGEIPYNITILNVRKLLLHFVTYIFISRSLPVRFRRSIIHLFNSGSKLQCSLASINSHLHHGFMYV